MTARTALRRIPSGVWLAAGSAVTLLLATAARYGFHRDELYFIAAGRRLDWGYVDQPPLTPLLARGAELVAGTSPFTLRILPALAVGAVSVLAATIARRMGGGTVAQVFAAFASAWSGVVLGEGHLLSTATFDYLLWTVALWILVMILDGADPRWWLGFGATIGLGMQNKTTTAFLAVAVLVALMATAQRRLLRGPLPWLGALVALGIALPNLIWQAINGWPQLEMAAALRDRSDGALAFVLYQPLLLSISLAVPAGAGLWRLAQSGRMAPWRPLAVVYGLLFAAFMATGGKAYYIAPMNSVLLAAGALWFEDLGRTGRRAMAAAAAVGVAVGVLIAVPVLPGDSLAGLDATGELRETLGWPELIDQVVEVRDTLPAADWVNLVIVTSNYGEAGAVEVLGTARGLPEAVSGHNNYWLWGPPDGIGPILAIGPLGHLLDPICPRVERAAVITNPWQVENEEFGHPILLCRRPRAGLATVWDSAKHYS